MFVLPLVAMIAAPQTASAAKKNNCTSSNGKKTVKSDGPVRQTLRSGQYYAYRHKGGTWTFCNTKGAPKNAFKTFNYDFNEQANVGVRLLSRPGKCVALQLRPSKSGGYPSVPTVDMRAGKGISSSATQIEFAAPGATVVKTALSSTCLLASAYISTDGGRKIQLNPIIGPNVVQETIRLSDKATDADLKALSLSGDKVTWSDAGVKQSKVYSGLPPR